MSKRVEFSLLDSFRSFHFDRESQNCMSSALSFLTVKVRKCLKGGQIINSLFISERRISEIITRYEYSLNTSSAGFRDPVSEVGGPGVNGRVEVSTT